MELEKMCCGKDEEKKRRPAQMTVVVVAETLALVDKCAELVEVFDASEQEKISVTHKP